MKMFAFAATFTLHLLATQLLVVENVRGIFFDLTPFPNLAAISYYVLGVSGIVFFLDLLVKQSLSAREIPAYVGFASVIPWVSPAIVEINILIRWLINGSFAIQTAGKGLGASNLNDILFVYGTRNFAYAILVSYSTLVLLRFREMMIIRLESAKEKRLTVEKEREWFEKAWENPLELLNPVEQSNFIENHIHLDLEQRNKILREKILPEKGILLIDPEAF